MGARGRLGLGLGFGAGAGARVGDGVAAGRGRGERDDRRGARTGRGASLDFDFRVVRSRGSAPSEVSVGTFGVADDGSSLSACPSVPVVAIPRAKAAPKATAAAASAARARESLSI